MPRGTNQSDAHSMSPQTSCCLSLLSLYMTRVQQSQGNPTARRVWMAEEHLRHVLSELSEALEALLKENKQLKQQLADLGQVPVAPGSVKSRLRSIFRREDKKSLQEWRPKSRLVGHSDGVWDVHAARNRLASSSADRSVRIWDEHGFVSFVYLGHKGSVNAVRFHPRVPVLASCAGDGAVHLSTLAESETSLSSPPRSDSPPAVFRMRSRSLPRPDLNSEDMLAETRSRSASLPHTSEGPREIGASARQNTAHTGPVSCLCWSFDGQSLITGGWDELVCLWDSELRAEPIRMHGHQGRVHFLDSSHHQLCLSSSADLTWKVWDFRSVGPVVSSPSLAAPVSCTIFARGPVSTQAVSASEDKSISLWDLRYPQRPVREIQCVSSANRLSCSFNGELFAAPFDDGFLQVFNWNGDLVANCDVTKEPLMLSSCCWAEDDSKVYSCGWDCSVQVLHRCESL